MAAETSNPSQIIEVAEIAWDSITPTIKTKILWSDPATKRRAQLTRAEPPAWRSFSANSSDWLGGTVRSALPWRNRNGGPPRAA